MLRMIRTIAILLPIESHKKKSYEIKYPLSLVLTDQKANEVLSYFFVDHFVIFIIIFNKNFNYLA
jgi:hypothetical protein